MFRLCRRKSVATLLGFAQQKQPERSSGCSWFCSQNQERRRCSAEQSKSKRLLQGLTASNFLAVLSYVSLPHPVLSPTFASKTAGTEFRVRLSNPYEGKKVKAFAKEKVWVLGSRVQSTLNGVHSTIARARSSVCRTRPFAFAEQKHPERASNFRKAKVPPFRQLLLRSRSKEEVLSVKVRLCLIAPKGG